ncbi:MAG: trypsin-like serine protease [Thermoanaerobacterales bacterium]|nr:trypsin-like serine protease [Thermoanaerobacterales bacterium]
MGLDKRNLSELKKLLVVAVLCSLIAALAATLITSSLIYGRQQGTQPKAENVPESVQSTETSIPEIAGKVTPAVVGISTVSVDYDFFYRPIRMESVGSGVIVDQQGYIVTNEHVVGGVDEINVFLSDGQKYKGKCLYADPALDIAVIKIDAPNLTTANLGDSDRVVVGDLAIAIGNPLGLSLQRSVTAGIISALNRMAAIQDGRESVLMLDLIQTDASINPGNSGGPLLDRNGEVIGINTIKASQAEAIGFAIPVNVAKPIVNSIIKKGSFQRPYLGIDGIDKDMARLLDIRADVDSGIYITDVKVGSPADKAGIAKGDIIVKLTGRRIESMAKLRQIVYGLEIGKSVQIEILRNGSKITRDITPEGVS